MGGKSLSGNKPNRRLKCRITRRDVTGVTFLCQGGICHLWLHGWIGKQNRQVYFVSLVFQAAVVFRVHYPDRLSESRHWCYVVLTWQVNSLSMIHHVEFTPGGMAQIQLIVPEAVSNFFQIWMFPHSSCDFLIAECLLNFFKLRSSIPADV